MRWRMKKNVYRTKVRVVVEMGQDERKCGRIGDEREEKGQNQRQKAETRHTEPKSS
jgi:hypothetical protein